MEPCVGSTGLANNELARVVSNYLLSNPYGHFVGPELLSDLRCLW
jgi:hypothetical protein